MLTLLLIAGCEGPQSALNPAGRDAEHVATLFAWMVGGAAVIWVGVIGLAVYAARFGPQRHDERKARLLIVGAGVVFPTVVLTALLSYGLSMMPAMLDRGPEGALHLEIAGEQWWWRVRYHLPDGRSVELANEVRLPVGDRARIALTSPDVVHSFWVPSLAGKVDMVPGRTNFTALEPTRVGVFRGVCAEYCGTSHAGMLFYAVVETREGFDAWLARQLEPARSPVGPIAERGAERFVANGCGACHTVRGTPADGVIGPDLTHVGGRISLGAGILPNTVEGFTRWISATDALKPDVHMPTFDMLEPDEVQALATYLDGLE